jgi:hypothetical protein
MRVFFRVKLCSLIQREAYLQRQRIRSFNFVFVGYCRVRISYFASLTASMRLMKTKVRIGVILAVSSLHACSPVRAFAHPASGIVVDAKGEVFFVHSGKGACKIGAHGELTYIHKDTGGHWMALDTDGKFASASDNRLFKRIRPLSGKPLLLFASGGAPLVVNRDGNLYYGSGFPDGDDMTPGGHTLTRMSPTGEKTLFSPALKTTLETLHEAVTGLATGRDGTLFVACPNAILKVRMDGTVSTFVHPVVVKDCEDDLAKDSNTRFFHSPYLRGLDVTEEGTVYAAVTGCRCLVKITPAGKVETVLKSEQPWTPTGVAVRGKEIYVLEYSNPEKPKGWSPRVRKLGPDGKVTTLATVAPE